MLFFYMHLYFNILSTIATISSLIILEILAACFSCSNSFNLSRNSLGFSVESNFEVPEVMIAGGLGIIIRDLFLLLRRPFCLK